MDKPEPKNEGQHTKVHPSEKPAKPTIEAVKNPSPQENSGRGDTERPQNQKQPSKIDRFLEKVFGESSRSNHVITLATIVIAISTCAYTVYAIRLYFIEQRVNEIAVGTQRAFVNFSSTLNGGGIVSQGKTVRMVFEVGWENSGTTPTKVALGKANIQAWSTDLPRSFDYRDLDDSRPSPAVIGPKATARIPVAIPIDDLIDVPRKGHHLFLWGWMSYRDIFEGTPPRLTEFCAEITNIRSDKEDMTDPAARFLWNVVSSCPGYHNCYDEDCKDYQARIKQAFP
ncbi:MAG: hypothetical protein LAO31_17575 [Acidobacteriia bacterium]|nr:hypothetical protein [Terriglobia bacterium]